MAEGDTTPVRDCSDILKNVSRCDNTLVIIDHERRIGTLEREVAKIPTQLEKMEDKFDEKLGKVEKQMAENAKESSKKLSAIDEKIDKRTFWFLLFLITNLVSVLISLAFLILNLVL
jgi:lipid II:glycine glycyltransferase (peptidoglycan interpeptide bridge formation enzyme)